MKFPFLDLRAVNAPYFTALKDAAISQIESGRYVGGPAVDRFNYLLAQSCDCRHAIGVSSGLDALRLIIEAYKRLGRLSEGDEVIVADNTYIASVLAISQAGLTPVLVDPDPLTACLSAEGIKRALMPRSRAVMLVDLYGRLNWDADIRELVMGSNLLVIEDAAQSIGARSPIEGIDGSRMAGAIGHAGALSFYPTKNIGALGDAGAVVTSDSDLAAAVKALANYGSNRRYHNIYKGFNCRLDPIQADFLSIKLADLERISASRRERAAAYSHSINSPLIKLPTPPRNPEQCVWHQYVVRLDAESRNRFMDFMSRNGVGTDIHYPTPVHRQPCYAAEYEGKQFPIADRLAAQSVSLPMGDNLSIADIEEISAIINQFQ